MKKSFWIYLVLTLSIMVAIFCFSAQPGEKSSSMSMSMTKKVVTEKPSEQITLAEVNDKIELVETIIRKSAHAIIFTALGFCVFMTLYHSGKMNKYTNLFIISFVFCIFYAASDEIHQLFVSERSGEVRDFLIDSSGSFIGILIALGVLEIKKKLQKRKA